MIKSFSKAAFCSLFLLISLTTINAANPGDSSSVPKWKEMMDSCNTYQQAQDYQTALKWALQLEEKVKEEFGETDTNYIAALTLIYANYYYLGNTQKVIEYCEKVKPIIEEVHGEESPEYVEILGNLGVFYSTMGKPDESEDMYKEALEISREIFITENPELAKNINKMAVFYNSTGNFEEAEPLYKEALELRRKIYKTDHQDLAKSINSLAYFYGGRGNFQEAEPLYKEALAMRRRLYKTDNPELASSIGNQAVFLFNRGKYKEAEPLYKEALLMFRRIYKTNHPELARSINNMAYFYDGTGKYIEAESLYKEALEMYRAVYTADNINLARCINNMAGFYKDRNNFKEAESLQRESLEMYRRISDKDYPELANSINNMANLYISMGNMKEAEPLFREALEMYRRIYRTSHPDLASCINNMAYLLNVIGNYEEAGQLYEEALEMYRTIFDGDHFELAIVINNMAGFYDNTGYYKKAEQLYKEALAMRRRIFRTPHKELASGLLNTATFYNRNGNYKEAEILFREASDMYGRIYKTDHPDLATCMIYFAKYYHGRGNLKEAEPLFISGIEMFKNIFNKNSSFLSEKEKEYYWSTMNQHFESFIDYAIVRMTENPGIIGNLYDNLLFTKALLFHNTNKMKTRILNSGDTALISQYRDFISKKEQLVKMYSQPESVVQNQDNNIDSLETETNELEKQLSLKSEDFKLANEKKSINWKTLKSLLNPDEAAVEIVRYRHYNKSNSVDSVYYAFLIIADDYADNPGIVILDNGNELENEAYNFYRNAISFKITDSMSFGKYWSKIYEKLRAYKRIYLSTDGIFNKLNPATFMLPGGGYLLEEQQILFVNSTRDILLEFQRLKQESNVANNAVLVANPDFDIKLNTDNRINDIPASNPGTFLKSLPLTELEVNNIFKYLESRNWKVEMFTGDKALKSCIYNVSGPRVLHIATHGMFLEDIKPDKEMTLGIETKRMLDNPLLRSGLFFAGSNNLVSGEGKLNINGQESSLLTAYEVINLELDRTELVVLSACETGLGVVKNGEGVFGLRRAFQQAGARSVLMSLWAVDDKATQELMSNFYNYWLSGMTKREAFHRTQLDILKKYRYPYYWGAFVMVGE